MDANGKKDNPLPVSPTKPAHHTAIVTPSFWIALIRYKHEIEPLVPIAMRERGYTVGDTIESEAAGHKAVLFPVWKHR